MLQDKKSIYIKIEASVGVYYYHKAMELLNLIIAKPDWETKINNISIVNKWKRELTNQKTKPELLDLVIGLLQDYKTIKNMEYEECSNEYRQWALTLGTNPTDVSIVNECECKCKICAGMEYYGDSDSDSDEYDKDAVCPCTTEKLLAKKNAYLGRYLQLMPGMIDNDLRNKFVSDAKKLDDYVHKRIAVAGKDAIEYQPNTSQKVVNLIHPSLRCYVKGITKTDKSTSSLFQWLPAEFDGTFTTRINGLDLSYTDLYEDIGTIFSRFVPRFEKLLAILNEDKRIESKVTKLDKCQVIVKMSNIELSANTSTEAGAWHLEGVPQENIIATGIYYYDLENVASHALEFRTTITDSSDVSYQQNCSEYVTKHYGMADLDFESSQIYSGKESYITLGKVNTVQDLCIVFPNFLQHRVPSVELEDVTKPGHRKILVFFLIHPDKRILSTQDIATEQSMSDEDAMLYRELLMFQRKFEISDQSKFFERGWSLCEH